MSPEPEVTVASGMFRLKQTLLAWHFWETCAYAEEPFSIVSNAALRHNMEPWRLTEAKDGGSNAELHDCDVLLMIRHRVEGGDISKSGRSLLQSQGANRFTCWLRGSRRAL